MEDIAIYMDNIISFGFKKRFLSYRKSNTKSKSWINPQSRSYYNPYNPYSLVNQKHKLKRVRNCIIDGTNKYALEC